MTVDIDKRREVAAKVRETMGALGAVELDGIPLADLIEPGEGDRLLDEYGGFDALGLALGVVDDVYCRVVDPCACGVPRDDRDMLLSAVREIEDALDRRLMPEGMEWPRFEDREPVRIGDEVDRGDGIGASVDKAVFDGYQWRLYDRYGCEINEVMMEPGERIKRPAPKVFDADGAEIRVGDTVWTDYGDGPWTVTSITADYAQHVRGESDELGSLDMPPSTLTHRAPVFAADGKPLREWETVTGFDGDYVKCRYDGMAAGIPEHGSWHAHELTHEPLDSWARLWMDMHPADETECVGLDRDEFVRRARALAERSA